MFHYRSGTSIASIFFVVACAIIFLTRDIDYRRVNTVINPRNDSVRQSLRPKQKFASNETTADKEDYTHEVSVNTVPILKCSHSDGKCHHAQDRIRKEKETFSLSAVFPHGGNTLPNFLIRGNELGLTPMVYRNGIVGFLHLNKAAGTSIKDCMTEMISQVIWSNRSLMVLSSNKLTKFSMRNIMRHNVFEGDHIFGLCEHAGGRNCSYFTFLRDPYDRALSSYLYCRKWVDQLCGPLKTQNFTIQQWVVYQGSYFFYELLMDKKYCVPNPVISDLLRYGMGNSSLIPPGSSKYISLEKRISCWFKQRVYLETFVNDTGREAILQNVLDYLEEWFSLVGMTEEFKLSMKMLEVTYDLPFFERCQGMVRNISPGTAHHSKDLERVRMKAELRSSPEVAEALKYDIMIYEKGREIFQRQRKQFEKLEGLRT